MIYNGFRGQRLNMFTDDEESTIEIGVDEKNWECLF